MAAQNIVVFDLDGTLIDSAPAIAASVNHVRSAFDRAPLGVEVVKSFMGDGVEAVIDRALAIDEGDSAVDRVAALRLFLQHHESDAAHDIAIYPGADALLERLVADGYVVALCTNKLTRLTLPLIANLGWADHFRSVMCGDTLPSRKPDPALLWSAIAQCGGGIAVFVGDTRVDMLTAREANVPFILVHRDNGYAGELGGAWETADDLDTLRSKIDASFL